MSLDPVLRKECAGVVRLATALLSWAQSAWSGAWAGWVPGLLSDEHAWCLKPCWQGSGLGTSRPATRPSVPHASHHSTALSQGHLSPRNGWALAGESSAQRATGRPDAAAFPALRTERASQRPVPYLRGHREHRKDQPTSKRERQPTRATRTKERGGRRDFLPTFLMQDMRGTGAREYAMRMCMLAGAQTCGRYSGA